MAQGFFAIGKFAVRRKKNLTKPALSQLKICRPPPSLVISLLWMMGSVLYSMGKIIKKFSGFFFGLSLKIGVIFSGNYTKMTITRKIKIGKI